MSGRSDAREVVLQMLYLIDLNHEADGDRIHENLRSELKDPQVCEFAWTMFCGIREHRNELDAAISSVAENWRIDRMPPTDRNALRLGAWELRHSDTPVPVVIDEAIELARKFGTKQSASFVNGILDKLVPEERRTEERNA